MKPTALSFSLAGIPYLGTAYVTMDCQDFVEKTLRKVGISKNLLGSNAWYREMTWTGSPEECRKRFGSIPKGAFLFILAQDGKEPSKYRNDGIGNASHIGIYTGLSGQKMVSMATATGNNSAASCDYGDGAIHDMTVFTIYHDYIDRFGLRFNPELDNGVYYVDPCDRDHYILLEEYFKYMKTKRLAELRRIAQMLGAKHFKITYKERSKQISHVAVDAAAAVKATPKAGVNAKANHDVRESSLSAMDVVDGMSFPGHDPIRPKLEYLKNEIDVVNLVDMRMDPQSPLQHRHFTIEMSNSSGIREKDAAKIDAVLKIMKISGNTTVVSEVQNEARRFLEYEIEF